MQWERIANGAQVQPSDVAAEFARVSSDDTKAKIPNWQIIGGGNFIARAKQLGIVTLRLSDAAFDLLFSSALAGLEGTMKSTPGFEEYDKMPGGFPADAQLGIISVIWANGPDPLRPGQWLSDFSQLCKARKWGEIATKEKYKWSNIRDDRDAATKKVFRNAQAVEDQRKANPGMDVTIVSAPYSGLML